MPVAAKQATTRVADKAPFTKHMIRLRRLDDDQKHRVGGTVCEVILKNANDGTSAYDLLAGLFRIECLNSLVTQTSTIESVKVRHSGDAMGKVIDGTYRVLGEAHKALAAPEAWGSVTLDRDEAQILAEAAHLIRFGDQEDTLAAQAIQPAALLQPRRTADLREDFWTRWNVVQENVIRGGLHGVGRDANNRARRVSTREVKGIDQETNLNKALWLLGERMAELKGIKAAA